MHYVRLVLIESNQLVAGPELFRRNTDASLPTLNLTTLDTTCLKIQIEMKYKYKQKYKYKKYKYKHKKTQIQKQKINTKKN